MMFTFICAAGVLLVTDKDYPESAGFPTTDYVLQTEDGDLHSLNFMANAVEQLDSYGSGTRIRVVRTQAAH